MPSVRPRTSWLPSAALSHTPACIPVFFSVSRRVNAMISATASSTTLRVLEKGALKTGTPAAAAADRSTWSVPMQKAPIAINRGAALTAAALTDVLDRIPSRCTSPMRAISSSSSRARPSSSTWYPSADSRVTAFSWMPSSSSARGRSIRTLSWYGISRDEPNRAG